MRTFLIALLILSLTSCAGPPHEMTTAQLETVSDWQLERALRSVSTCNQLIIDEADRRGLYLSHELSLIKNRKVQVGMSEKALLTSWGKPNKINKSVGSHGINKQYIYRDYSQTKYVYVENGEVASWQD
jgi:hypothetical protein